MKKMMKYYLLPFIFLSVSGVAQATLILDCKSSNKNPHYKLKTVSLSGGYEKIVLTGPDETRREYFIEGAKKIPVGDEMALFGVMITNPVDAGNYNLTLVPDNRFEMYSVRESDRSPVSMDTAFFFDHQATSPEDLNLKTGKRTGDTGSHQGSLYFSCASFPRYLEYIEHHYPGQINGERTIQEIASRFTSAYIDHNLMFNNHYLGVEIWQNPFDMWVFQQMITELKPDVIVETGTAHAGSTLFFATILEKINPGGRIITIELDPDVEKNIIKARSYPVFSQMVRVIKGDSVSADTIRQIQSLVDEVKKEKNGRNGTVDDQELVVLVTLDSLHSAKHVLKELELYSQFVSPGSYILVQDTIIDKKKKYFDWFVRPWAKGSVAGPAQAVREFLEENPGFQRDRRWEKYYFTFYPGGFLKKIR
ncbi:MAG: class I SAM-dependent methyltransferase [Deltaproteobacteria bacterium]|nr:class I SAM-dependent methyltransferase [Deltaproteobacteria bacterium]